MKCGTHQTVSGSEWEVKVTAEVWQKQHQRAEHDGEERRWRHEQLLVIVGCFNLIYGIAAIAKSHVLGAGDHRGGRGRAVRAVRLRRRANLEAG